MTDEMRREDRVSRPVDLTEEERAALAALPRERDPGRLLEERTVRVLRDQGLLAARAETRDGPRRGRDVSRGRPRWQMAAAIAAGVALFAGGVSVGQTLGARQTADAFHTVFEDSDARLASQVQRAGSDYVASLAALAESGGRAAADSGQALEVALTALWAAANEIVSLAPDDPLAARILQGFQARSEGSESIQPGNQLVVEF